MANLKCVRCGKVDGTVAATVTRSGAVWPATCSECVTYINRVARGLLRREEAKADHVPAV